MVQIENWYQVQNFKIKNLPCKGDLVAAALAVPCCGQIVNLGGEQAAGTAGHLAQQRAGVGTQLRWVTAPEP